jgi:hypothetical protein
MTTVSLHAERLVELKLRTDLCECLAKQNAELDELMEMHAKAEGRLDVENDVIAESVDEICKAHALGVQGPTNAQLGRIAGELRRLQAWRERFEQLVKLCMEAQRLSAGILDSNAARAICAEVDRLKEEECPF